MDTQPPPPPPASPPPPPPPPLTLPPPPPPLLVLQLPPLSHRPSDPPTTLTAESQPITVRYILIESNLNTAVSVDLPDLLPLRSRQSKKPRKQKLKPPKNSPLAPTPLALPAASTPSASFEAQLPPLSPAPLVHVPDAGPDGGGGVAAIAPLDTAITPTPAAESPEGATTFPPPSPSTSTSTTVATLPCGLRYYIRCESSPRQSRWILEYAHVNAATTNDLPRAGRLYGLEQELTLRFTNPPLTRGDFFRWPAGKRRVGVFRCTGNGTLDALQNGDKAVVRKLFFKIGMPTIRSGVWIPGTTFSVFAPRRLYSWLPPAAAAAAAAAAAVASVDTEDDSKDELLEQRRQQQQEEEEEKEGVGLLMADDEGEEGGEVAAKPLLGSPTSPTKLKKKTSSSLASFLEFVGMTGGGAPYQYACSHTHPSRIPGS